MNNNQLNDMPLWLQIASLLFLLAVIISAVIVGNHFIQKYW